jgi:hypothetical protein
VKLKRGLVKSPAQYDSAAVKLRRGLTEMPAHVNAAFAGIG